MRGPWKPCSQARVAPLCADPLAQPAALGNETAFTTERGGRAIGFSESGFGLESLALRKPGSFSNYPKCTGYVPRAKSWVTLHLEALPAACLDTFDRSRAGPSTVYEVHGI